MHQRETIKQQEQKPINPGDRDGLGNHYLLEYKPTVRHAPPTLSSNVPVYRPLVATIGTVFFFFTYFLRLVSERRHSSYTHTPTHTRAYCRFAVCSMHGKTRARATLLHRVCRWRSWPNADEFEVSLQFFGRDPLARATRGLWVVGVLDRSEGASRKCENAKYIPATAIPANQIPINYLLSVLS